MWYSSRIYYFIEVDAKKLIVALIKLNDKDKYSWLQIYVYSLTLKSVGHRRKKVHNRFISTYTTSIAETVSLGLHFQKHSSPLAYLLNHLNVQHQTMNIYWEKILSFFLKTIVVVFLSGEYNILFQYNKVVINILNEKIPS